MRKLKLSMRIGDNVKTTREQLAVEASIDRLKLPDESGCVETWQPADQGDNRALDGQMGTGTEPAQSLKLGNKSRRNQNQVPGLMSIFRFRLDSVSPALSVRSPSRWITTTVLESLGKATDRNSK